MNRVCTRQKKKQKNNALGKKPGMTDQENGSRDLIVKTALGLDAKPGLGQSDRYRRGRRVDIVEPSTRTKSHIFRPFGRSPVCPPINTAISSRFVLLHPPFSNHTPSPIVAIQTSAVVPRWFLLSPPSVRNHHDFMTCRRLRFTSPVLASDPSKNDTSGYADEPNQPVDNGPDVKTLRFDVTATVSIFFIHSADGKCLRVECLRRSFVLSFPQAMKNKLAQATATVVCTPFGFFVVFCTFFVGIAKVISILWVGPVVADTHQPERSRSMHTHGRIVHSHGHATARRRSRMLGIHS